MITRQEYMTDRTRHHDYYLEIALEADLRVPEHVMERVRASNDPHLNDVPLFMWDALARGIIQPDSGMSYPVVKALQQRGDNGSLAGIVCALKALARHLRDSEESESC